MIDTTFISKCINENRYYTVAQLGNHRYWCEYAGCDARAAFLVKDRAVNPRYLCEEHFNKLYGIDPRDRESYE